MNANPETITILIADDDADDRLMAKEALEECRLVNQIDFVEDGVELLDYLHAKGRHAARRAGKRPGLIILDLNMPKMDGREALRAIKADPLLRRIPIVVMTTSKAEEDIYRTYDLGVNSFITKPVTFEGLVAVMRILGTYWIEIVELPDSR
ncbi:MAG TPA: response regulator [Isosphaeraceae bacterium]|nr:response regulator [Isosphaeraceae bacterium]